MCLNLSLNIKSNHNNKFFNWQQIVPKLSCPSHPRKCPQWITCLPKLSSVSECPVSPGLVSVASTRHNLECVGTAVSVGQPVLLLGDVGVGKTSLVMEWAARTGQKVVTLQVPMTI